MRHTLGAAPHFALAAPLLYPGPSRAPPLPGGLLPPRSTPLATPPPCPKGLLRLLLSLSSCLAWRSPARRGPHHQCHQNRRGAEIYLATSSSLAGSRSGRLHRAVRVDTAEVLPVVALRQIGSSRKYISSRLDESSCGDRLANPCTDKTRFLIFKGKRLDLIFATFI